MHHLYSFDYGGTTLKVELIVSEGVDGTPQQVHILFHSVLLSGYNISSLALTFNGCKTYAELQVKKRSRHSDGVGARETKLTSAKRIFIVGSVQHIDEEYDHLVTIMELLDLESVGDICPMSVDMKMILLLVGKKYFTLLHGHNDQYDQYMYQRCRKDVCLESPWLPVLSVFWSLVRLLLPPLHPRDVRPTEGGLGDTGRGEEGQSQGISVGIYTTHLYTLFTFTLITGFWKRNTSLLVGWAKVCACSGTRQFP